MKKIENIISKKSYLYPEINSLLKDQDTVKVKILTGAYKSMLIKDFFKHSDNNILLVVEDYQAAENWFTDLNALLGAESTVFLQPPQKTVKNYLDKSDEYLGWLIDGLNKCLNNKSIAICTPDIFYLEIPKKSTLQKGKVKITVGDRMDFEPFVQSLLLKGFDRKDYVENQGEMSIRGGIVDIFPLGWDNPLRIDFWGDEIESIREFNPISQRSINEYPAVEFIADLFLSDESDMVLPYDYFDASTLLVIDDPEKLNQDDLESQINNFSKFKTVIINSLQEPDIFIKTEPQTNVNGLIKPLVDELERYSYYNYQIIISADGRKSINRLKELIEYELESRSLSDFISKQIVWMDQPFSEGFISEKDQLVLITEHQIFNRLRTKFRKKSTKKTASITFNELQALNIGDYVVHEDKGIAHFQGFRNITIAGALQDCIQLGFAEGDKVFVNMNYISKISKYTVQEGVAPHLTKLGSGDWLKKKLRAKKKIKDIARDLIKLYAKRKSLPGFQYPLDTEWQKEFEASFIYEDTPDQLQATEDIKIDMESVTPMDRLICGDVGFGKTEVAIRAAFKAVQAGKQAAILVPTTILAEQHYMSFKDRMGRYPINIEAISRFRTKKEQDKIVERLELGKVDILIGTHRLLSKDIKFKDLGLLVVDEEHRFGVSAKEKLRHLRETVDTLTLTATPIPRTLNFSLMGARDLSIMETPPRNRLPVYTEIIKWDEDILCDAFVRETNRGGQVFFVTDKVKDIEIIAAELNLLMPTLRFGIAHGQMTPAVLEKEMEKFIQHKYDVLLSTKIIESGIDIPNANTIIINRANNFGLAELYQLRGRVGRTNKQAYCYLIIPDAKKLIKIAIKRLQAVEEFTDLGSGYKLAMRDMEIRGAGNLLGAEQSGFIIDIGIELYQKVLDEAVRELKNEEFADLFKDRELHKTDISNEDVAIEIGRDALFPSDYISNSSDRYFYYKQLYKVRTIADLNSIVDEITDKYGRLPKEATDLIYVIKLRIAVVPLGFMRVSIKADTLRCEFPSQEKKEFYDSAFPVVLDYIQQIENAKLVQKSEKLFLDIKIKNMDNAIEILWRLKKQLEVALF
ncbi:MAG: transcription-repair coupling factor [bacterium]